MSHGRTIIVASLATIGIVFLAIPMHAGDEKSCAAFAVHDVSIAEAGAIGDDATLNTENIQTVIDQLAAKGGGTVVVPKGVFRSGALFLKPGVNLHFHKGGVIKGTADSKDYPERRIRIEGHFEEHYSAGLINAEGCDDLQITGEGTLDGNGRPIWKLYNASADKKNFRNLAIPRAQLCIINNSKNVRIDGVTFKDSQFWNLHLYNCRNVTVQNARFQVPDDYKQAPSTDGIDVDSCQDVEITSCYFSVTDDCIAMKGSKGPFALDDKANMPIERVHVSDCTFKRGQHAVTCGSEATVVRNLVVENSRIVGDMTMLNFKLRKDTPQIYEDICYRGLTLEGGKGRMIRITPWTQYTDLKGQPPPTSIVRRIVISDIKGDFGEFGGIAGNRDQTEINNIAFENIDVRLNDEKLTVSSNVKGFTMKSVTVNGKPYSLSTSKQSE